MQATMDVSRPAARRPTLYVSRLGLFRTWVLTWDASIVVSSEVEHQTLNLEVAGSTPVPHRRLKPCSGPARKRHPTARGRRAFDRSAAGRPVCVALRPRQPQAATPTS